MFAPRALGNSGSPWAVWPPSDGSGAVEIDSARWNPSVLDTATGSWFPGRGEGLSGSSVPLIAGATFAGKDSEATCRRNPGPSTRDTKVDSEASRTSRTSGTSRVSTGRTPGRGRDAGSGTRAGIPRKDAMEGTSGIAGPWARFTPSRRIERPGASSKDPESATGLDRPDTSAGDPGGCEAGTRGEGMEISCVDGWSRVRGGTWDCDDLTGPSSGRDGGSTPGPETPTGTRHLQGRRRNLPDPRVPGVVRRRLRTDGRPRILADRPIHRDGGQRIEPRHRGRRFCGPPGRKTLDHGTLNRLRDGEIPLQRRDALGRDGGLGSIACRRHPRRTRRNRNRPADRSPARRRGFTTRHIDRRSHRCTEGRGSCGRRCRGAQGKVGYHRRQHLRNRPGHRGVPGGRHRFRIDRRSLSRGIPRAIRLLVGLRAGRGIPDHRIRPPREPARTLVGSRSGTPDRAGGPKAFAEPLRDRCIHRCAPTAPGEEFDRGDLRGN